MKSRGILKTICNDIISMLFRNIIQHYSISSKIFFLVIYCLKVFLFFIKEVVVLSKIFAHLQESAHQNVSLILKLIVQLTLALTYGIFLD